MLTYIKSSTDPELRTFNIQSSRAPVINITGSFSQVVMLNGTVLTGLKHGRRQDKDR